MEIPQPQLQSGKCHLRQMLRGIGLVLTSLGWECRVDWVPPLPSMSLQAPPAQAEDGSRSDMVGFESLGSEGTAGWSSFNPRHSTQ